jgi:hypothetical protein
VPACLAIGQEYIPLEFCANANLGRVLLNVSIWGRPLYLWFLSLLKRVGLRKLPSYDETPRYLGTGTGS